MTKFHLFNIYSWIKPFVPPEIIVIYHSEIFFIVVLALFLFVLFIAILIAPLICRKNHLKPSIAVRCLLMACCLLPLLFIAPKVYAVFCYARATVLENQGKSEKSIYQHLNAIRCYPTYDSAYESLTMLLIEKADYDNAMESIKKYPNWEKNPFCLAIVGDLEYRKKNFAKAARFLRMADALHPETRTKYKLAFACFNGGQFQDSITVLKQMLEKTSDETLFWLYAKNLLELKDYVQALKIVDETLKRNPMNPVFLFLKAQLLSDTKHYEEAINYYEDGLSYKRSDADALYKLALLRLKTGDYQLAKAALYKTFYYDNSNVPAYLSYELLENMKGEILAFDKDPSLHVEVSPTHIEMEKGEVRKIEVRILSSIHQTLKLKALPPYGRGVGIQSEEVISITAEAGRLHKEVFEIEGKRASEGNLNRPWTINIVVWNGNKWNNVMLRVNVSDHKEGRVFFVLTQDQEVGEKRNDHWDKTPNVGDLDIHEVETDLILKRELAEKIAKRYGIKWTHMVDIGSSLLLIKWAALQSEDWNKLWMRLRNSLMNSYRDGNDLQLHIHMGSIPGSRIFEYRFDTQSQQIILDKSIKEKMLPGRIPKSWANVLPALGDSQDLNTRNGSLLRGRNELEHMLGDRFFNYCVNVFRAGEWDFGIDPGERQKSILALRQIGIYVDSSATTGGSYYDKAFTFGRPIGKNAYFSASNDVIEKATSLTNIGILEIVPPIMPQGRHPIAPTDDPRSVLDAYQNLSEDGLIKPGINIIMEIEHLSDIHSGSPEWDNLNPEFGKWDKMDRHFRTIKRECPKLEYVTATEAIQEWLNYYTPDPILLLTNGKLISESENRRVLEFDIDVLGKELLSSKEELFPIRMVIPSYLLGTPQRIRLLGNGQEVGVFPVNGIVGSQLYFDLRLSMSLDYKCRIEVKPS